VQIYFLGKERKVDEFSGDKNFLVTIFFVALTVRAVFVLIFATGFAFSWGYGGGNRGSCVL